MEPAATLTEQLLEQLTFHWEGFLRPKLDSLTDDEYHWEPVEGCWGIRRRQDAEAPVAAGAGDWAADFAYPEPDPPPVTTIAWRISHLVIGVFGIRNASHFGGPPMDYVVHPYAGSAEEGLAQLDEGYQRWVAGVAALDDAGLARPVGEAEGPFAAFPYTTLVLHIHREVIHHGAEVLLLRDLWRARGLGGA
jgi:hypothetical protein